MRLHFFHQAVEIRDEDNRLELIFPESYPYKAEVKYIQRRLNYWLNLTYVKEAA